MRMTQLDAAKLRAAYGCPPPNIPKLLANQEAVKTKKKTKTNSSSFNIYLFSSPSPWPLRPRACGWRTVAGTPTECRSWAATACAGNTTTRGRWRGRSPSWSLGWGQRWRKEQLESLARQSFCFPSRRTTFSAGRNPMSGSGEGGQSIAD